MSLAAIIQLAMSIFTQLTGLVAQAVTANTTNDQATLDAIHTPLMGTANALRPLGTEPLT